MKRIFALVLSLVFLLSCLVLPAGAMFDPSPVYQGPPFLFLLYAAQGMVARRPTV